MTTSTLSRNRWIRLLTSRLRKRKTATIQRNVPLSLWELEDRVAAGSVFHLLFGGLSMGYLGLSEGAVLSNDSSASTSLQAADNGSFWASAADLPIGERILGHSWT